MENDNKSAENLEQLGQIDFPGKLENKEDNPRGNIWYLPIIGHIEGHMTMPAEHKTTKYEHLIPMLLHAAESCSIDGMLVVLNTVGGDVEAGLAIAELISHFTKPTVSLVLGGGHSIGVPLSVAAKYSYISASAAMTIHPVRMSGTVVGAQQTYDYFNKMQERILNFTIANAKIKKERLTELMMDSTTLAMDVGTFLIGQEAVDVGLIDEVGGLNDAMEKLYNMIEENRCKMADDVVKLPNGENL
ncbi:MAG: ATP-dependent Clp protease proteolytic subunit [Defluviitaleaceae bacterium]|nr:ATP-dependent Clp protease proteolytic subunit [Defluviitaleaceae bacterium]